MKWGFKRDGKISKDTFVKKGETPRVIVDCGLPYRRRLSSKASTQKIVL